VTIQCAQEKTVRIKDYFAFIIQDHITAERAAMARPADAEPLVVKDNTTIVMDCGASSSLTGSLLNTKEISEKVTRIETADGAETMKATHHCMKTYFVRNRMGETKPITVPALYVRGLPQDLLGGKSLTRQNIRVILDDDADIGGIYPLDEDCNPHYQDSFEFINDPARDTDLFYLQTEKMDCTTLDDLTGYDLWHRRLGHIPHQNIKDTICYSFGLEDLAKRQFKPDEKCPSCMIGKSTLENYPGLLEPATRPLARVNMDLYSSSITSIEGYNHALVFTDSNSSYRWEYGMKTKS